MDANQLRDGQWYSILLRQPRTHRNACWHAKHEAFVWQGTSEDHLVGLDEVAEILERIDGPVTETPG
ncbi:MAG: hypothetical protein PHQ28_00545 [Mycobacterium sp.]|nr:hypothetical protein [Mycobacterium sp.]